MHEETVLKDLRRKVEEVALAHGARRVTRVTLRIGALSHLTASAVLGRWPLLVTGTVAEGSAVDVDADTDETAPGAQGVRLVSVALEEA